ncbi:MAG: 4-hydroxy-tetrahydrodipicolinate reductase [Candidatus Caenarcaniphilales bacterium]|nr:4-hydroxy-tetrahydrodipicolinate reductase [Candidatus Caenarcaniphilales bacterium]
MDKIKVIVAGALGRMGSEAVKTFIEHQSEFELIGAAVRDLNNVSPENLDFHKKNNINLTDDLHGLIESGEADVMVELTTPDSVYENSLFALKNGVRPVIGATGLTEDDIKELSKQAQKSQMGAILAPNFALGAVLMMRYAFEISKYYDKAEIIELHHDKKVDMPSGTAIKTSDLMKHSLGSEVPIHSVRLPGLVAKQQVIFGSQGETLTIEHNSIDRTCFMPGIRLSCKKVMELKQLIYGLENIL